jgi:hypothetical protein
MPLKHQVRRREGANVAWSLTIALLTSTNATAQLLTGAEPPLDLRYRHQQGKGVEFTHGAASIHLERAIQASTKASMWELGVATWQQALRECLAGPYAGASFGVLGSAQARPEAQPDHCRRF